MNVSVVGGGAWGTALASHCARAQLPVRLWARETEVVAAINEAGRKVDEAIQEKVGGLTGGMKIPGLT